MSALTRALAAAPLGLALLFTLGGGLAVHAHYGFPAIGIDDANISFAYARNFAAGEGLVFSRGFERVEGFTSAAWTALCALAFALHPAPERGLVALSLALTAAALWLALATAARLARAAAPGSARAAGAALGVAALWLAGLPRFYAWNTASLMESPLWSLLDVAAAASLVGIALADSERARQRALRGLAASAALLLVTRPESLAVVPALYALAFGMALPGCGGARATARALAPGAALQLATLVALIGARLAYFGYPLPNTYYAKVSPDRLWGALQGLRYLVGYFEQTPAALLLALAALALALRIGAQELRAARGSGRRPEPAARAVFGLAAFCWLSLLLPLGGGGDHFSSFRFHQVAAPLLVLPVAWLAARAAAAGGRARLACAAVALVLALGAAAEWRAFLRYDRLGYGFRQAEAGRRKASALNEYFAPELRPSLGAIATGGLGFRYAGRVVDLMGLNWSAMGHSPGDRKGPRDHAAFDQGVFWTEPADLVAPDLARRPPRDACPLYRPWELSVLQGLYLTPRFAEHYRAGSFETPHGHVSGFFRDEWLAKLPPGSVALLEGTAAECERRFERARRVASRATARSALLILIDTLGMKHVSLAADGHTPHLAELARRGVFFANATATAPWTQPSLASVLTGLLPAQHGVRVLGGILQQARETLPELLEARGLQTAAIVSHELLGENYGFAQGFEHFDASHLGGHGGITSQQVTDAAIEWLDARDPERPFFLMVHYFDPHYAYQHHPEFSLTQGYRGPLTPGIGIEKLLALRPTLEPADIAYLVGLHREEAAFTDAAIGRLLARLEAAGLGAETLVVATADHGEEFMERGWIGHTRTLYQELLHVPLVFRHPALPARLIDTPVSLIDLAPTLAELLGVAFPETPGGGHSFARALRNPKLPVAERDVVAEVTYLPRIPGNEQAELMRAVKTSVQHGSLKAIRDATSGAIELYDLAVDPGETHNLYPDHPRAAEMAERALRYAEVAGHASAAQVKSLIEEEARRLEALGYVQ